MSSHSKKEKEAIVQELKEVLDDYENLAKILESQIVQNKKINSILDNLISVQNINSSETTPNENDENNENVVLQQFLFSLDSQESFDKLSFYEVNQLLPISVAWIENDNGNEREFKARGCAFLMAAMAKWRKELFEENDGNNDLFKRLGTIFTDAQKFAQVVEDRIISESEVNYCIKYFNRKNEFLL